MWAETLAILMTAPERAVSMEVPKTWQGKSTPPTRFRSKLRDQASRGI